MTVAVSASTKRDSIPMSDWERLPPYPKILLGDNIPWINATEDGVCPGCRNLPLTVEMYCLRCDRWGFDDYGEVIITPHVVTAPPVLSTLRDKVNKIRASRCQSQP